MRPDRCTPNTVISTPAERAGVAKGWTMPNKLHNLEQQAGHAQCLALLVEFVTAVRGEKVCLMCRRGERHAHTPGCAVRRADAFIKTRDEPQPVAAKVR